MKQELQTLSGWKGESRVEMKMMFQITDSPVLGRVGNEEWHDWRRDLKPQDGSEVKND